MSDLVEVVARAVARRQGRAFPMRETYAIAPDGASTFAIAPLKIVSEEVVQAIAFGDPDKTPQVIVRWNPLSRESGDLLPLAKAIDDYITHISEAGDLHRFWLPHKSALTVLDLLGHRYRTNKQASDELKAMGAHCRAIATEAAFEGQQVVCVAADLLRTHFVTGQAPIKDAHLDAFLAWLEPKPGVNPCVEADARALVPASGVLVREDDDEVERLRSIAKAGGRQGAAAKAKIDVLLTKGVMAEWALLVRARRAFWATGLSANSHLDTLINASRRRVNYAFPRSLSTAAKPDSLSRELAAHEWAAELTEASGFQGDSRIRELARRKGRAIQASIARVRQPTPNRLPCRVWLRTAQDVLRVRAGTMLRRIDGRAEGRVVEVSEDAKGRRVLVVDLTKGVQRSRCPAVGTTEEWVDTVPQDMSFVMQKVYGRMKSAQAPLVYGANLAKNVVPAPATLDYLRIATGLRRP
jgi:hypothetical protein